MVLAPPTSTTWSPEDMPGGRGRKPCKARALSEPAQSETATPSSQPVEVTWSSGLPLSRRPSNIQ